MHVDVLHGIRFKWPNYKRLVGYWHSKSNHMKNEKNLQNIHSVNKNITMGKLEWDSDSFWVIYPVEKKDNNETIYLNLNKVFYVTYLLYSIDICIYGIDAWMYTYLYIYI